MATSTWLIRATAGTGVRTGSSGLHRPLGYTANLRAHDSTPETLIPEGNKSRVSGDGPGSKRPETNFPRISVDSNRVDCLVEKSGLVTEVHR